MERQTQGEKTMSPNPLKEGSFYLACNEKRTSEPKRFKLWSYQKVCDALNYLFDVLTVLNCRRDFKCCIHSIWNHNGKLIISVWL